MNPRYVTVIAGLEIKSTVKIRITRYVFPVVHLMIIYQPMARGILLRVFENLKHAVFHITMSRFS